MGMQLEGGQNAARPGVVHHAKKSFRVSHLRQLLQQFGPFHQFLVEELGPSRER